MVLARALRLSLRPCLAALSLTVLTALGCASPAFPDETDDGAVEDTAAAADALSVSRWSSDFQLTNEYSGGNPVAASSGDTLLMVHPDASTNELWYTRADLWGSGDMKIPNQSSESTPGLAAYNSIFYMVHQGGSSNELWMATYTWNAGWTNDSKISSPSGIIQSTGSPALAFYNGQLHMVYRSASSSQLYWTRWTGGSSWLTPTALTGKYTALPPALAAYNGALFLAHRGYSTSDVLVSAYDGNSWSAESQIPGTLSASAPALAVYQGYLHLAHRASSSTALAWTTFDGSTWAADQAIPSHFSTMTPTLATSSYSLYLIHNSDDGSSRLWASTFN